MALQDEEYIAESRDPTPEPQGDLPPEQVSPSHPVRHTPSHSTNGFPSSDPQKHDRVPDMQLGRAKFVRLHDNVNYVAAALILRGEGVDTEILLIQEAKKSCYEKWYLPAGRVEAGETLIESVHREVMEEAGYSVEVNELLSLQVQGSGWYRFSYTATVIGGTLKTHSDKESLQAQWFKVSDVTSKKPSIKLRGRDFLKLVDEAMVYRTAKRFVNVPPVLPINEPHAGLFIEFMICKYSMDNSRVDVLVHKSIGSEQEMVAHDQPFPTCEFGFEYFFAMVISKCYRHLLDEGPNVLFIPSHVVRIRCAPTPMESIAHGLKVRLFCEHKKSAGKAPIRSPSRYHWLSIYDPEIRRAFHMEKDQYKPSLYLL
ncbi:unnamed protein product, partial [Mesorhabditis belari]|uniref:Nudix hydrolase domain-containing protein n=1 Tax=Mesorhabditis belari TaxID=2138241 RepID=A0AAF3F5E1_9BILA